MPTRCEDPSPVVRSDLSMLGLAIDLAQNGDYLHRKALRASDFPFTPRCICASTFFLGLPFLDACSKRYLPSQSIQAPKQQMQRCLGMMNCNGQTRWRVSRESRPLRVMISRSGSLERFAMQRLFGVWSSTWRLSLSFSSIALLVEI